MTRGVVASVADVRRLAQRRTSNLYDTYFTRVLSAPITAVLARFPTPPNAVTLFNVGIALLASCIIAFGEQPLVILVGIGLIHLYAVLDSVDGELARLLKQQSALGVVLEAWSAYLIIGVFPLAAALYLYRQTGAPVALWITLAYMALGRFAMPAVRRALTEVAPPNSNTEMTQAAVSATPRAPGLLAKLDEQVLYPTNMRLVVTTLIGLHLLWSGLEPLLLWSFLAYMAAFLLREIGILYLIIFGDVVSREAARFGNVGGSGD